MRSTLASGLCLAVGMSAFYSTQTAALSFLDIIKSQNTPPQVSVDTVQDNPVTDNSSPTVNSSHAVVSGTVGALDGNGVDMIVMLDDSASLSRRDPTRQRFEAVRQLANSFDDGVNVRMGLGFYADQASVVVSLKPVGTSLAGDLNGVMENRTPAGQTDIAAGIAAAHTALQEKGRADSSKFILLFTDGEEADSQAAQAASAAVADGIIVHVFGLYANMDIFSGAVQRTKAQEIAQAGSGEFHAADTEQMLPGLFRKLSFVGIQSVTVTNTTTGTTASTNSAAATFASFLGLSNCSYTVPVNVSQGTNDIEVKVTDIAGNSATETVTVEAPLDCPDPNGPHLPNYNPQCATTRLPPDQPVVKLRPQVVMAGFDPMMLDIGDDRFKVMAVVREGANPVRHVTLDENTGSFSQSMRLDGQLPNGDKVYSMTLVLGARALPGMALPNLFGSGVGEFNISVIDEAQQKHSFPNLDVGNNPMIPRIAATPATGQSYTSTGPRRSKPQPLMVGLEPTLLDITDDMLKINAIVRPGSAPIRHVTLKTNDTSLAIAMRKETELLNGDVLYSTSLTFLRSAFPQGAFRDLFGTAYDGEFIVEVTDEFQQSHTFPTFEVCNCPEASGF